MLTSDDLLLETEQHLEKSLDHVKQEFRTMRTGRAHPGLVETIRVDYYGTPTPIRQLANIMIPEPQQIMIRPFDVSAASLIEKAIHASDLGISPQSDGKIVRLTIPPLSEERRKKLVQMAKKAAEAAKVSMRNVRRDSNKQIKDIENLPEDAQKKLKDDIQDLLKSYEDKVDALLDQKTKELMEI